MNIFKDNWMQKYWRPLMAISYMVIVLFDFILFPMFWSLIQLYGDGSIAIQWNPMTLLAGGVFHAAMGAILGVSAWTRGQEKIERLKTHLTEGDTYHNDQ